LPTSGSYREPEWKSEIEMFCPYCNTKLYDVFPYGVCNYVSRDKSKGIEGMNKKKLCDE